MGKISDKLRMSEWGVFAFVALLGLWAWAPQQVPVVGYKVCLVTLAAHLGYWIDRRCFPYTRPTEMTAGGEWQKAEMRRAILMASVIVAMAMAL